MSPDKRKTVLEEYKSKCQTCGRRGPGAGGIAKLDVHHIERHPADCGEHDLENLSLLCRPCHTWHHNQTDVKRAPVEITEADRIVLLPQDIEILRLFEEHGPMRTAEITKELVADLNTTSVRERLCVLMGLDNLVEERETQIVDEDDETGDWGLNEQVENSIYGRIPEDRKLLLQRATDERLRRALDRGCSCSNVATVLDISTRSTFYKRKRAAAYEFPLDAFNRGGRPTAEPRSGTEDKAGGTDADEDQQHLDVEEGDDHTETRGEEPTENNEHTSVETIEQNSTR